MTCEGLYASTASYVTGKGGSGVKIIVLQAVIPAEASVKLQENGQIDETEVQYTINPYDTHALEEALRLKERLGGEVVVVSVGTREIEAVLRNALALGADRVSLLVASNPSSVKISRLLAAYIEQEPGVDLILCGWVSAADSKAEVPGRLSEQLKLPLVNLVTKMEVLEKSVLCRREDDAMQQWVELPLPAMLAVDKRINEPRFPTVQSILQANKAVIALHTMLEHETNDLTDLPVYQAPAQRRKANLFESGSPEEAADFLLTHLLATTAAFCQRK